MSSSNNDYNNSNSGVYPFSLYLSSLSGHQDIIRNPYNHQSTASPGQMVSAVPESLTYYMSNSAVSQQGLKIPEVSREIKKAVKKDRHSKIHTAQGLRDRRVRLSIGVARQFFDLQDMLGFDKASKTLDWLLKKSRRDIKELIQEKKLNGGDVEEGDDDEGDKSFEYFSSPESCQEVVCEVKKTEKSKAKGKSKEITREMTYDKKSIIFNEGEDMTHSFYNEAIQGFDDNQQCILTSKRKVNLPTDMDQRYNQHYGTFMLKNHGSSSSYNTILPQNVDFDYDQSPFYGSILLGSHQHEFPQGVPMNPDIFGEIGNKYKHVRQK